MKIIIDAMSGDNAPQAQVSGCVQAAKEFGQEYILVGQEAVLRDLLAKEQAENLPITIHDAQEIIDMHDDPATAVRRKKDASMSVALRMIKDGEADAMISAGNTGALLSGATLVTKRIRGIRRAALPTQLPCKGGHVLLIDSGANVECTEEYLLQFAFMGSFYMEKVMGIKNPRVGLANVGAEEHKGTELYRNTYELLQNSNLNFIGNVEGRDIPNGVCDVVVCDGFTGNLILKTYEGVALVMMNQIKNMFMGSVKGKLAAGLVMKDLKNMKTHFDYNRYGGAPILGASKPVFKAHGSAKTVTVKNAIRLSVEYVKANAIEAISSSL